ncbi:hypothetical protein HIM67_004844 [Escherichia coli]|nr:hypothetical protein [Escherichia coli]
MTLSFFITVIPGHDKPQPPGCLLGPFQRRQSHHCPVVCARLPTAA